MHILGLAVDPDSQRRGLARGMVEWIEQKAIQLGHNAIVVDTIAETGNVDVFERLGFASVDTSVPTWCQSDVHDTLHCVQMEKRLSNKPDGTY